MTTAPDACVEIPDWEKRSSSDLLGLLYDVIPLNPREHPVKELVVIPVYVIISESISSNPKESGNPVVEFTVIVLSAIPTLVERLVESIRSVNSSILIYLSIFCKTSNVDPWPSKAV